MSKTSISTTKNKKSYDLVLQGGGVRAIALVGAIRELENQGYVMQRAAGTSAGAIVGALYAAGYTGDELYDVVKEFNFSKLRDKDWVDRLPYVGKALSILWTKGIYEGDALFNWLKGLFDAKGIKTFGDLRNHNFTDKDGVVSRYKIQVIVSDITQRQLLVLPRDAKKIGMEPDELSVPLAIRMSSSIPIFFEPVHFKNPVTNKVHILVDGAILSNFPIWFFDTKKPRWPTFGLTLKDTEPDKKTAEHVKKTLREEEIIKRRYGIVGYLTDLVQTMLVAHDRHYLERSNESRMITIPALGIGLTNFDLPDDCIEALFESGQQATKQFLDKWHFEDYIREFRNETSNDTSDESSSDVEQKPLEKQNLDDSLFGQENIIFQ